MITLLNTATVGQTERALDMDEVMVVEADALTEDSTTAIHPTRSDEGRPNPEWVRGRCPECGDELVSNLYYIGGRGYIIRWECWGSLQENPQCQYKRVL